MIEATKPRVVRRSYLGWLVDETQTKVWHDSADPQELDRGLQRGLVGVTTNPFLTNLALTRNRAIWEQAIRAVLEGSLPAEEHAEALMRIPITAAAARLLPEYERSGHEMGYVCAQVNPGRAGDREAMQSMAERFAAWAPNIAVKLPATSAGMDVLEECVARGITVTSTVNFTVPQVLAAGERCHRAVRRAHETGVAPGRCFAVVMVGRLDDYLADVACDTRAVLHDGDIRWAGLAVVKRARKLFLERGYEAVLLVAAQRGAYHVTELAGADLVVSLPPAYQDLLENEPLERESRADRDVPADVVDRLRTMPEFVRAYEPDGMTPAEFIAFGATQRTLTQFADSGWKLLEQLR